MKKYFFILIVLLGIFDCKDNTIFNTKEVLRLPSPAGWCIATVYEFYESEEKQNTQVILNFIEHNGTAGAVSFNRSRLGLKLRWIDSDNLEISYPKDVTFTRNASGEKIQFLKRFVNVHLVSISQSKGR